MAPFLIPVNYQTDLLDFKEWLIKENSGKELTPKALRNDFDYDLLYYFFELIIMRYNRPFPTLMNTDDELLQFSKSYFKLEMLPEEALNHLLPLTLSDDSEGLLRDAKRTSTGAIKCIELPWLKKGNKKHKNWDTTLLGYISIEKGTLTLETNSERRTQKGKKLLMQYLGEAISFQQTLIESPEQKLQSLPISDQYKDTEHERLMALPEVQEQLQAMAKSHWQNWFDEPIPALKNKTPRQAAKTVKGRERLEALLLEYECLDSKQGNHPLKANIAYLKSELKLN